MFLQFSLVLNAVLLLDRGNVPLSVASSTHLAMSVRAEDGSAACDVVVEVHGWPEFKGRGALTYVRAGG